MLHDYSKIFVIIPKGDQNVNSMILEIIWLVLKKLFIGSTYRLL